MKIEKIDFSRIGGFSPIFLDYLAEKKELTKFYNAYPKVENFGKLIKERSFSSEKRLALQEVLTQQYGALEKSHQVEGNLLSLTDEKTFTVTTGHQLNIFTGPLYFIFKIVTTINLAKALKKAYPDYHFVPVYWMASEDHDFEEINHFYLFGKKYTWETQQTGAVGRFATQSLNMVIDQLEHKVELFEKAYLDSSSLSDAVRLYCNELFGDEGLIVVDADNHKLKGLFADVIKKDLTTQAASQKVAETNAQLDKLGYKTQAFTRDINFFFLNGSRDRILFEDGKYKVKGSELSYTEEEITSLVDFEPERFSPNVIMRPLYQEVILPNLAYVGGPAEVAYWLQLKGVFDHYQTPFPALMPRNFGMVLTPTVVRKAEKLKLSPLDVFKDAHDLKAHYLEVHTESEYRLDEHKKEFDALYRKIQKKATEIDVTLHDFIAAEETRAIRHLDHIEKKLRKASEKQHDIAMGQIDYIKEHLFPGGGLQERRENFLTFQLNNPEFVHQVKDAFDPFDFRFYQFWEA
jgi:bacillithiol biosynthesis cysteine-adding enzyme BshC